jgi:hypothetical protein
VCFLLPHSLRCMVQQCGHSQPLFVACRSMQHSTAFLQCVSAMPGGVSRFLCTGPLCKQVGDHCHVFLHVFDGQPMIVRCRCCGDHRGGR